MGETIEEMTSSINMTSRNEKLTTMTSDNVEDYHELREARETKIYVKFYMLAVVLPVGFSFNIFAFAVLMKSKNLRRTTTGRLLIALTIADNIYLVGE